MAQHQSSRRQLIGGTASLMLLASVAAGAAKAQELDGELIAGAAEYAQLEDEYRIVCRIEDESPDSREREIAAARMEVISNRQADVFSLMSDTPARTPEGLRAKAVTVRLLMANRDKTGPADVENWLAWSLIEDVLGRTGA